MRSGNGTAQICARAGEFLPRGFDGLALGIELRLDPLETRIARRTMMLRGHSPLWSLLWRSWGLHIRVQTGFLQRRLRSCGIELGRERRHLRPGVLQQRNDL